jgi:hypothetical protein
LRNAGQHRGRFAVDGDHYVVERRIRLAVRRPPRVVGPVSGRVPAPGGEIESADERQPVVDEDDLLVVRARQRVRVVVAQVHAPMRVPREPVERRKLAVGAEHHRVVPVEHAHVQPPPAPGEIVQEVAERDALAAGPDLQRRAAVEVPGEDHDRALGALGGAHERLEVALGVDEQRDAARARDGAAVLADLEKAVRGAGLGHGCAWTAARWTRSQVDGLPRRARPCGMVRTEQRAPRKNYLRAARFYSLAGPTRARHRRFSLGTVLAAAPAFSVHLRKDTS